MPSTALREIALLKEMKPSHDPCDLLRWTSNGSGAERSSEHCETHEHFLQAQQAPGLVVGSVQNGPCSKIVQLKIGNVGVTWSHQGVVGYF